MSIETQNELKMKVAELCPNVIRYLQVEGCAGGLWQFFDGEFWRECVNNDLLRDFNACAEIEKTIPGGSRGAYFANLGLVIGQAIQPTGWYDAFLLGTATAEERYKAFVATMIRKSHHASDSGTASSSR